MTLYLDASLIVPLLVRQDASPSAAALVRIEQRPFHVSEFGAGEVASALARLVRMRAITATFGTEQLAALDKWRSDECAVQSIDVDDLAAASALVRRFELGLRMPDALHATLCLRHGHDLVTLDRGLAQAARAIGVLTHFID